MASTTVIDLYTDNTPNGHKITCTFEELGVKYNVHHIDISKNTQKEEWFLKINPNGRIPAIVDKTSGKEKRIFEGGAILLYVTAKYDAENRLSFAYDTDEYWEVVEWLVWMQSGLGPMQGCFHAERFSGQANHFYRYAPEKIQYGIKRYQTETKRLYQVLEDRLVQQEALTGQPWLVGGRYTIADIACFSWVNWAGWAGVDLSAFPKLHEWQETIDARPAIQRGVNTPSKFHIKEIMKNKEVEEAYQKEQSKWVMAGQEAEHTKHKKLVS